MSYLDEISFPYYPSEIWETKPLGQLTLRQFIKACSDPKDEIKQLFADIKKASKEGDLKLKAELKKKLFYFNPCVNSDGKGRSYDNITAFTGLVQIDFDGISDADAFRDDFFNAVKSCVVAMVSPSGLGVKCLLRIPVVKSVDEYKEYFCGLGYYLSRYKGFDISCYNPVLPLFLCYDPNLKYREDARISTIRGRKINKFGTANENFEPNSIITEAMIADKRKMIINGIKKIVDNAHPQIRDLSSYVGGLVAGGYFSEEEIYIFMCNLIDENTYMQKNLKGYKRTCLTMIKKGLTMPVN